MQQIKILSVNISEKKGTIKVPVNTISLDNLGVEGDAHAGNWHRQVSLLGKESYDKMNTSIKHKLNFGEFAENITTEGFPLYTMKPLDRLVCGNIILEITQIGKKCHGSGCEIFKEAGDCVMPREGIFCRVIQGGVLAPGDILEYQPRLLNIQIVTLSDRASEGVYEDKSGPLLRELSEVFFASIHRGIKIQNTILPDNVEKIKACIKKLIQNKTTDIIFTTGGTGIGPHDYTPDAIKPLLDKEIPGIMELIRVKYGMQTPNALISRSIAGVAGKTLIYVLPGNPKAVKEYTDEIFKTIEHTIHMLYNIDSH